jgi:5-methylcytosine-specific restriction protein A
MARRKNPDRWREWYNDARWRRRRDLQLKRHPLCEDHLARGEIVPAVVAHHVEPHCGDINKFLTGPLRSLCKSCHDRTWADDRRGFSNAIGVDGRPTDPRHPCNAASGPFKDWPTDTPASPYSEQGEPPAPEPAGSMPRHLASLLARGRKRAAAK